MGPGEESKEQPMHLERIEIAGFRGIRRLSLTFDEITTLIGENTWGKSSLLDALSVVFLGGWHSIPIHPARFPR